MNIVKEDSFRSSELGVNRTDNMMRIVITCTMNEYKRYFIHKKIKRLEILDTAIEACQLINEFHSEIFCGYPLQINGETIDHTKLNHAYDKADTVLKKLQAIDSTKTDPIK
jgi:hypothetical protein